MKEKGREIGQGVGVLCSQYFPSVDFAAITESRSGLKSVIWMEQVFARNAVRLGTHYTPRVSRFASGRVINHY